MIPVRTRRRPPAKGASKPAPVGGWNARDALSNMPPEDAVILENWFPDTGEVRMRRGYASHAAGSVALHTENSVAITDESSTEITTEGPTGAIETLMEYSSGTTQKLFAATPDAIYDATISGTLTSAVQTGLTNGRWQHVMFGTAGGDFLYMVNGDDAPRYYDGSTWTEPSLTGVTASDLIHVQSHQRRLWFIEKNTLSAWYLGAVSVAGALTEFNLAPLCTKGGSLLAMGTWTRDGGDGMDDLAVWVTTEGEVIVYQGTDPSSASTWGLVGRFELGSPPVGRRCLLRAGSDLIVLTEEGAMPLSAVLSMDRSRQQSAALTDKIRDAIRDAMRRYRGNFGWQMLTYSRGPWALINVPLLERTEQQQYVMNSITGAWCKFKGMNASCWAILGEELYFGGNSGSVFKADTGDDDNGSNIVADMQTAFDHYRSRGTQKRFTMVRPIFKTNGTVAPSLGMNVDYSSTPPTSVAQSSGSIGFTWGVSRWGGAAWASSEDIVRSWNSVTGVGYTGALRLKVEANGLTLKLISYDVVFEPGAFL